MRRYSKTSKQVTQKESILIEQSKKEKHDKAYVDHWFLTNKINRVFEEDAVKEWIKCKYKSFYIKQNENELIQCGVEKIMVIPHKISYMSKYIANFKLFSKIGGLYSIYNANYGFQSGVKQDQCPFILCQNQNGDIFEFNYNAIYAEEEIYNQIVVYDTIENIFEPNLEIDGDYDRTLHINIDGRNIKSIKHITNYGRIKENHWYYWYSFWNNGASKYDCYIVNIKTGESLFYGEIEKIAGVSPSPENKYLNVTRKLTAQFLENKRRTTQNCTKINEYFSQSSAIDFDVMFSYISKIGKCKIIPNICSDDPNVNYMIEFDSVDVDSFAFILYMMTRRSVEEIKIFDMPLSRFYQYLTKEYDLEQRLVEFGEEPGYAFQVVKKLEKKLNSNSVSELANYLNLKYEAKSIFPDLKTHLKIIPKKLFKHDGSQINRKSPFEVNAEQKYREVLRDLQKSGQFIAKWKSEYTLYILVSAYFNNAVFQYYDDWLGHQSLDIFIPEINVGIEYQGIQHFFPVDYFGGEEKFQNQRERDERKQVLCKKNKVKLLFWPYSKSISIENLEQMLKLIEIELPESCNNRMNE